MRDAPRSAMFRWRGSRSPNRASRARGQACALALLGALLLPGCYERTIKAEGWDYDRKAVQKPLAPDDGPVEDLIFGPRKTTRVDEKPQPRKKP